MKRFLLLAALCCVTILTTARAQQTSGNLTGHVDDSNGHAVPNANIVVRSGGNFVANAMTDERGDFAFSGVDGSFDVTISHQGLETLTAAQQAFASGKPTRFKLIGELSTLQEPQVGKVGGGWAPLSSPVASAANRKPWVYGLLVQGGVGLQDRTDFNFLMIGGHAGKVLTPELGSGLFKGNVEYAIEVFPFWQSITPKFQRISCPAGVVNPGQCTAPYTVGGRFTGASVTPIILRWNYTHGRRLMPWIQAAGGVVWTDHKYPAVGGLNYLDPTQTGPAADTSVWNFTPQGGIGVHYFVAPRRSIDVSANGVHISSASIGDKNPGVNSSVQFSVGYSWWK
jgi:hypothetical protein